MINEIPVRVRCEDCVAESSVSEFPFECRSCGNRNVEVVAGEELYVEALELEGAFAGAPALTCTERG